jgi:hypothetical protein
MCTLKFAMAVASLLALWACTGKTVDARKIDAGTDAGPLGPVTPPTIASGLPLTPHRMAPDETTPFWTDRLGNLTSLRIQQQASLEMTPPISAAPLPQPQRQCKDSSPS